jgi:hypothetical protein
MPSITINQPAIIIDGPILEVQFLVPTKIEQDLKDSGKNIPYPISVCALIDTGASHCNVQDTIPALLGLVPVGSVNVKTTNEHNHQTIIK